MKLARISFLLTFLLLIAVNPALSQIVNGNFETGNFTGWTVTGPHVADVIQHQGSWCGHIHINQGNASGQWTPNAMWELVSQSITIAGIDDSLQFDMEVSGSSWHDGGYVWMEHDGFYDLLFQTGSGAGSAQYYPWETHCLSLAQWAGQTVNVVFSGHNWNGYGDHQCDIYFDNIILIQQFTPGDVQVTLTPVGLPIQIPAAGGSFDFNVELENFDTVPVTFHAWTMATLPNGSEYGPLLGPVVITIAPGGSINRDRSQYVPQNAPTGNYTYDAYVGTFPDDIWDEDHFAFEKLAFGDGEIIHTWFNWGESFHGKETYNNVETASNMLPLSVHPNPFNPAATLSFSLPEASNVSLKIYDITGRLTAIIADGWLDSGVHEVAFDGSDLASGVYIYHLQAGKSKSSGKMLLIK